MDSPQTTHAPRQLLSYHSERLGGYNSKYSKNALQCPTDTKIDSIIFVGTWEREYLLVAILYQLHVKERNSMAGDSSFDIVSQFDEQERGRPQGSPPRSTPPPPLRGIHPHFVSLMHITADDAG